MKTQLGLAAKVMPGLKVFGLCILAAFVCAFTFAAMFRVSLSPDDEAYGISMAQFLSHPPVIRGVVYVGLLFGVLSFPFAYFAVRNRRLLTSALFIFGVVIAEILLVTPFAGWCGLVGSVPALSLGLLLCRISGWRLFAQQSFPLTARCQNDLPDH